MSVGVVALMISLSACSTEQWEKAFGFGYSANQLAKPVSRSGVESLPITVK